MNQPIPSVTYDELRTGMRRRDLVLVDALPEASFRAGHLPDARSLPLEAEDATVARVLPDKSASIVVYCGGFD